MLELLRRHAPLMCGLMLIWSAHSQVSEELSVEAQVQPALPVFMDELLVMRDTEQPAQQLTDPFRNEISLEAPLSDLPPVPESWDDVGFEADYGSNSSEAFELEAESEVVSMVLDLQLESLADTGDARSSARINGQLVRQGDRVRGWEPAFERPLVMSIAGSGVLLRFLDQQYILNFNGRSSAHLMRQPGTAQQSGRPSVASPDAGDTP